MAKTTKKANVKTTAKKKNTVNEKNVKTKKTNITEKKPRRQRVKETKEKVVLKYRENKRNIFLTLVVIFLLAV